MLGSQRSSATLYYNSGCTLPGVRWLYDLDLEIFRAIHVGLHRDWLDPIFWLLSYSGLGQVQALAILGLLFFRSTKALVLPLLTTLIVAGIPVAQGLKHLLARDRPSLLAFAQPQEEFFAKSFPSGHTTTAFGIAFMLWLLTRGKEHAWVGRVALGWAFLVGISRIYRGVHWPTDVVGGLFGGLFAASLVYLVLRWLGRLTDLDQRDAPFNVEEDIE